MEEEEKEAGSRRQSGACSRGSRLRLDNGIDRCLKMEEALIEAQGSGFLV